MSTKLTRQEATDVSYVFPKSEEINIHKSDLQIQLDKFKKRVLSSFSVFDLLAIVSLWAPLFSAEFKKILNFESGEIRAGYIVFAFLITIFILLSRIKYFIFGFKKRHDASPDPGEMAKKILEQCQSQPK